MMKNLLIVLLLIFETAFLSAQVEVVQADSDRILFGISNKSNKQEILVIRESKTVPVAPAKDIKVSTEKLIDINKTPKTADGNFIIATSSKTSQFEKPVGGLKPETKYSVDIYRKEDAASEFKLTASIGTATVAPRPDTNSTQMVFSKVTDKQIGITWKDGKGAKRLVVARKGAKPDMPRNGKTYKASAKFGDKGAKLDTTDTYVVYNGAKKKGSDFLIVTGLDYGLYHFMVVDYNGEGEFANYNTDTSHANPRKKNPLLPAPVLQKEVEWTAENIFKAMWNKIGDGTTVSYEVVLAEDEKFKKIVPQYNNADYGPLPETEIVMPDLSKEYYLKIRAKDSFSPGPYSNVIRVSKAGQ